MPTPFALPTYTINGWSANVDDDFGARWTVATQDSTDGPTPKLRMSERPYGAGAYRAQSFPAARPMTLQGNVQAGSRAATAAARSRFLAIFTGGGQYPIIIDDGIEPKQTLVELAAIPKVAIWEDGSGFDWQLPLSAADPRYYDTTVQTTSTGLPSPSSTGLDWSTGGGLDWTGGGTGGLDWGTATSNGVMTLSNSGNADSWPTFTLTGPLTMPALTTATGQVLAYSGQLSSGDTLVIATAEQPGRSVLLNGSDRFTLMTSATWFAVPPSSFISVTFSAVAGSGGASASWANASW